MRIQTAPQPIPYQGSKRKIAPFILDFFPNHVDTLFEPFAGSAAVTVLAAKEKKANQYVVSDLLEPLVGIWDLIINHPEVITRNYRTLWNEQLGNEKEYFLSTREKFNEDNDPCKLLYLIARCVKNAIRFNGEGKFNQSADNRRKGMNPDTMEKRINEVSGYLKGHASAETVDYSKIFDRATSDDLVYLDPPYVGVSNKKDPRYFEQLDFDKFVSELKKLNEKKVPFILSFDGRLGKKTFNAELPKSLKLKQLLVNMGRSSQATLLGKDDISYESLYLSPFLLKKIEDEKILNWIKKTEKVSLSELPSFL